MWVLGGEWPRIQTKLRSVTRCSPPAVWPGSQQFTDQDWSLAQGLGTPSSQDEGTWGNFWAT